MWLTQSDKIHNKPVKKEKVVKGKKKADTVAVQPAVQPTDAAQVPVEKERKLCYLKGRALVSGSYYLFKRDFYRLHHFTKTKVYLELLDERLQPVLFSAGANAQQFSKNEFQWDAVKMAGPTPTREEVIEMTQLFEIQDELAALVERKK